MYIKKQRLLTPGPTPLLPQALHAMMGSDIHHRTEDFRKIYRAVLADLKEVMGTSNDVLALVSSGTGAMEASVANLFSPGDRVIVCTAGKFGERWVEIAKAFGLDAVVLEEPYGGAVSAQRVIGPCLLVRREVLSCLGSFDDARCLPVPNGKRTCSTR